MDTLLIAGIDTVVGANLAATLSDHYRVIGFSFEEDVHIEGCETEQDSPQERNSLRSRLASLQPDWIVFCPAGDSVWHSDERIDDSLISSARLWAQAADEFDARFTLISSDALFTGPWMFHEEESQCRCSSPQAGLIQSMEEEALQFCPDALIVRTHAYGWSPGHSPNGWIEQLLETLEKGSEEAFDATCHATPILATDLAEILHHAYNENLAGIYHIAGAERANPARFVRQLAEQFDLPDPQPIAAQAISQRSEGFASGEMSLQTKKIRKALCLPMPLLNEGLHRLYQQQQDGYRERLNVPAPVHEKVA